jgi:hypothetical protein
VLRWSRTDTKHTRMGRATPVRFNFERIVWRSNGERRRSSGFSADHEEKNGKGKWGPAVCGVTMKGEGVWYGLAQHGGGARSWTPSRARWRRAVPDGVEQGRGPGTWLAHGSVQEERESRLAKKKRTGLA